MRLVFFILIFALPCLGGAIRVANTRVPNEEPTESESLRWSPQVSTVVPVFAGAGVNLLIQDHFETSLSVGVTPSVYYSAIGGLVASLANNPSYKDLINAAFQSNYSFRLNLQYAFRGRGGWKVGTSFSRLGSTGTASVNSVLQATTGRDYSTLLNDLAIAGKRAEVTMNTSLWMAEVYGGYTFEFNDHFFGRFTLGVLKIIGSNVQLATGLPAFEASPSGKQLIQSSQTDLEGYLTQYGITPTLGISVDYYF